MYKTTAITLALVSALVGFGAVAPAQAATRSVMISTDAFANRCANQQGQFVAEGDMFGCQIGDLKVACAVAVPVADCEWNGKSEQLAVVRLLGAADFESITDKSLGGGYSGVVGGSKTDPKMAQAIEDAVQQMAPKSGPKSDPKQAAEAIEVAKKK
jgi:hypothetical protein